MPISLSQQQTPSQVQRQELVPAQIQSLEILQASMPELEQKLNEILASNPTLELVRGGNEQLAGNPTEGDMAKEPADGGADLQGPEFQTQGEDIRRQVKAEEPPGNAGTGTDAYAEHSPAQEIADAEFGAEGHAENAVLERLERLAESWTEYFPGEGASHAAPSGEEEERRQHRFDSLAVPVGLQDTLMAQLRQQVPEGNARRLRIGEEIIGSIDDTGYLRSHVADIGMACGADAAEVKEMLALVQQFDPPGVGARDLRECLLLQLERQGRKGGLEYQAVSRHLSGAHFTAG